MRLILFDIDGTLIEISRLGRSMLGAALRKVYGTNGSIDSYSFAGKTDRRMARELVAAAGWTDDAFAERLPALYQAMAAEGARLFTPGSLVSCPGVPALLAALAIDSSVTLGLLTGNIQDTVAFKLRAAELDPGRFVAGAYGSDSEERDHLLAIAQQRAGAQTGGVFTAANTVVIGDTPADIRCAQFGGARAIAVGTGGHAPDALQACGPDVWFETLADTAAVLAALKAVTDQ